VAYILSSVGGPFATYNESVIFSSGKINIYFNFKTLVQ
jgi:hypothetical protein